MYTVYMLPGRGQFTIFLHMYRLYLIRHAPTKANLSGSILRNYDGSSILPLSKADIERWRLSVGIHICGFPSKIHVSPALRCRETANALFPWMETVPLDEFREFDCSGLGNVKFWEISEDKFASLVPLGKDTMLGRIDEAISSISTPMREENAVVIGHGMFIRAMWWWFKESIDARVALCKCALNKSAYDLINSNGFVFKNLDMIEAWFDKSPDGLKVTGLIKREFESGESTFYI